MQCGNGMMGARREWTREVWPRLLRRKRCYLLRWVRRSLVLHNPVLLPSPIRCADGPFLIDAYSLQQHQLPSTGGSQVMVENTPSTVTKERYGMHMVRSSKASTPQTPEINAASQSFNKTVRTSSLFIGLGRHVFSSKVSSSQVHSLPVKDDPSEEESMGSAWKRVPLPSQSGISSTATTPPLPRLPHAPHPPSSAQLHFSTPST